MIQPIELSLTEVPDSYNGKAKGPYVAKIVGPGDRYALERSFVKWRNLVSDDGLTLPARDGVYEVRDFPEAQKRVRYFQVKDGAAMALAPLGDDEVLDAVASSIEDTWAETLVVKNGDGNDVVSTSDVLEAIDQAERSLVASYNGEFGLDEEDVRMELDKIRRVVERL